MASALEKITCRTCGVRMAVVSSGGHLYWRCPSCTFIKLPDEDDALF